jgi:hypothetical protein
MTAQARGTTTAGRAPRRPTGAASSVYAELDDVGGLPGRFFVAIRHAGGAVRYGS